MEMTARQAADRLGVSKDWVHRRARAGAFAGARRVGAFWVIPEEALEGVIPPKPGRPRLKATSERLKGNGREAERRRQ